MEATELVGSDELGAIDLHFTVEAIVHHQVMGHADSMRLIDNRSIVILKFALLVHREKHN